MGSEKDGGSRPCLEEIQASVNEIGMLLNPKIRDEMSDGDKLKNIVSCLNDINVAVTVLTPELLDQRSVEQIEEAQKLAKELKTIAKAVHSMCKKRMNKEVRSQGELSEKEICKLLKDESKELCDRLNWNKSYAALPYAKQKEALGAKFDRLLLSLAGKAEWIKSIFSAFWSAESESGAIANEIGELVATVTKLQSKIAAWNPGDKESLEPLFEEAKNRCDALQERIASYTILNESAFSDQLRQIREGFENLKTGAEQSLEMTLEVRLQKIKTILESEDLGDFERADICLDGLVAVERLFAPIQYVCNNGQFNDSHMEMAQLLKEEAAAFYGVIGASSQLSKKDQKMAEKIYKSIIDEVKRHETGASAPPSDVAIDGHLEFLRRAGEDLDALLERGDELLEEAGEGVDDNQVEGWCDDLIAWNRDVQQFVYPVADKQFETHEQISTLQVSLDDKKVLLERLHGDLQTARNNISE